MKKIKVLVVDDSAFMRKMLREILSSDPDIEVIGVARNGKEAVEKVNLLSPDVITMDVEMPVMTGIQAVEKIMKQKPTPIIMVSAYTDKRHIQSFLLFSCCWIPAFIGPFCSVQRPYQCAIDQNIGRSMIRYGADFL